MRKNKYNKPIESPLVFGKIGSQNLITPITGVKNNQQAQGSSELQNFQMKFFHCQGKQDVMEAVKSIQEEKLRLSTKKCAETEGLAFIDLSKFNGVSIDKTTSTVKVQGGALVSQMDRYTYPLGMAVPAGLVSHNRVADLIPTGGQSFLMNQYGLTVDHLRSVEMVMADGRLIKSSEVQNQDLFAALKGKGKVFGMITSMEFNMQPIEKESVGGMLIYPMRLAKKVINSFRKYAMLSPNQMSVSLLFLTLSNGLKTIGVHSAWVGNIKEGIRQLRIFQGLLEPLADFTQVMPYFMLQKGLDPYIPGLPRENSFSGYFPYLSPEMIEKLLVFTAKIGSDSRVLVNALKGAALGDRIDNGSTPLINWYIEIIPRWSNPNGKGLQMEWAASFWEAICSHTDQSGKHENMSQDNALNQVILKYDPNRFFE